MKFNLLITAAAALATLATPALAEDGKLTKVLLLHTAAAPFAVPYVAADQGFFEKNGVDIELKVSVGGVLVQALVSNSAQVALPTPTVVLQALESGLELKTFATTNIFPDDTPAGVVVGIDSGIKSAADLTGKRVGVPGIGGLLDVTMRRWIDANGGDRKSVNIVEVALPQTADALRGKQADAIASVDPFVSRAVDTGAGTLLANYLKVIAPGSAGGVFTTSKKWADENPEAIAGMQRALEQAAEFMDTHPVETRAAIARFTTLPPPVVANVALPDYSNMRLDEKVSFGFWNELSVEQGLIKEQIDLSDVIIDFPAD